MKRGFLLLILLAGLGAWLLWPGRGPEIVRVDVTQGKTGHQIARELQQAGHLKSVYPFLAWTKLRGAGSRIHVGRYEFLAGRSAYWIVDDLIGGRTVKNKFVIPEGFSSWQIAERLEEQGVASAAEFKQVVAARKLEGYLFPATYDLDYGLSAEAVANIFKNQFDRSWSPEFQTRAESMGWTKEKIITLASIIEREVVVGDEAPLVSAVYHNRLKKNMMLQADPTVQFALGVWKQRLLYADLRNAKSPYNTYQVKGLPPGPICSPSERSIQAALYPAQTDDLYFVASEGGRHTFSQNYRDHSNKVNKRRAAMRKKK